MGMGVTGVHISLSRGRFWQLIKTTEFRSRSLFGFQILDFGFGFRLSASGFWLPDLKLSASNFRILDFRLLAFKLSSFETSLDFRTFGPSLVEFVTKWYEVPKLEEAIRLRYPECKETVRYGFPKCEAADTMYHYQFFRPSLVGFFSMWSEASLEWCSRDKVMQ